MELERLKKEIVLAMAVGDGCIVKRKPRGFSLSITHSSKQRDYLIWKINLIESNNCLVNPVSCYDYYTNLNGKLFK